MPRWWITRKWFEINSQFFTVLYVTKTLQRRIMTFASFWRSTIRIDTILKKRIYIITACASAEGPQSAGDLGRSSDRMYPMRRRGAWRVPCIVHMEGRSCQNSATLYTCMDPIYTFKDRRIWITPHFAKCQASSFCYFLTIRYWPSRDLSEPVTW